MKHGRKLATVSLLVLVLLLPLSFGCGGGGEKGVTISIGEVTDLTGTASPSCKPIHTVLMDLVRYYNDEGLIPGGKLRVISFDDRMDPGRAVVGYDWCTEKRAKVIFAVTSVTQEQLKAFADRDRVPVAGFSYSKAAAEPPGWVFLFTTPAAAQAKTLLKWLSENHWDYADGIPKVGFYGWSYLLEIEIEEVIEDYCQAHPDKFDYVGSSLVPLGQLTVAAGDVEKLKDCDYVYGTLMSGPAFFKEYSARGYHATFITDAGTSGFYEFVVDLVGWDNLDGMISTATAPWWNEENATVTFVKELISRYHAGSDPEDMGFAYLGSCFLVYSFLDVLRQAAEKVGVENFDGQAFYDTAVKFRTQYEGLPEYYFTDTVRYSGHNCAIYEWSATAKGLVRRSDWLPLLEE